MNLGTYLDILKENQDLCDEYLYDELFDLIDDEEQEVRDFAIKYYLKMHYFS